MAERGGPLPSSAHAPGARHAIACRLLRSCSCLLQLRAALRCGPDPAQDFLRAAKLAALAWQPGENPGPTPAARSCSLRSPDWAAGVAPFVLPYKVGRIFCPPCRGGNMSYRSHPPGPPMIEKTPGCWLTLQPTFFLNHPGERARPPAEPPGRTRAYWLRDLPSGSYPQRGA